MLGFGGRSEARLYSPTFKKDQMIFIAFIDKTLKGGVISFLTWEHKCISIHLCSLITLILCYKWVILTVVRVCAFVCVRRDPYH